MFFDIFGVKFRCFVCQAHIFTELAFCTAHVGLDVCLLKKLAEMTEGLG